MATLGISFSSMKPDIDEKALRHPDPYGLPVVVAGAKCDALLKRVHIPAIVITADQIVVAPAGADAADGEAGPHSAACPKAEASASVSRGVEAAHDSVVAAIRLPVGSHIENYPGASAEVAEEETAPPEGNGRVASGVAVTVREKPRDAEEAKRFIEAYSGGWVQCVSGLVVHNTATGARAAGVDVATVRYRDIPADAVDEAVAGGRDAAVLHCCGAVMVEHPALAPYVRSMGAPLHSVMGLPEGLLRTLMLQVGWEPPTQVPVAGGETE